MGLHGAGRAGRSAPVDLVGRWVCGGLGAYLQLDPTLVRVLVVLLDRTIRPDQQARHVVFRDVDQLAAAQAPAPQAVVR